MSGSQSRGLLDVYLGDELLGTLEDRTLGYVAFDFDEGAIERHGVGARLLSVGLPVAWETVDPLVATPFFAGLLPEGDARRRLADEFRLGQLDTWGLLRVIGRESAGALVIVPPGEPPPEPATGRPEPLSDEQLAAQLERLRVAPLGVTVEDDQVRLSLAGVQSKLPLVSLDGGGLALPLRGQPSTVIAKRAPPDDRFPGLVANEAFCLSVAAALGVPTTAFRVISVAGRSVLLVDRYDRLRDAAGRTVRLHQEDCCQAVGVNPEFKYETGGGPSLERIAALLSEHSLQPGIDRLSLLRLTAANLLLGNCDAHGKNLSLLHTSAGVQLAPAYDIVSTEAYTHTDELGMRIGGRERLREVSREALLEQAGRIGVGARLAERVLGELRGRLPAALESGRATAEAEAWAAPVVERIAEQTRDRAARLLG